MPTPNTPRDLNSFGNEGLGAIPPGITGPPNPHDPLFVCPSLETDTTNNRLPEREKPAPLPRINLQASSVTFLERLPNGLDEDAPSGVFRVHIADMGERLLKIFHGVDKERIGRSFTREASAYRNLLHSGVCAAGVVPHCYGWFPLRLDEWKLPKKGDWLSPFRDDLRSLKVLVLEFLPDASRMTLRYVTPETAKAAWNGLLMIHEARVEHNDLHPRNILVLPNNRVVWVDFECASSWPFYRTGRWELQFQLWMGWGLLYRKLMLWKWYALKNPREEARPFLAQLEEIEQDLVSKGAVMHPNESPLSRNPFYVYSG